jgi:hypothetical protein
VLTRKDINYICWFFLYLIRVVLKGLFVYTFRAYHNRRVKANFLSVPEHTEFILCVILLSASILYLVDIHSVLLHYERQTFIYDIISSLV